MGLVKNTLTGMSKDAKVRLVMSMDAKVQLEMTMLKYALGPLYDGTFGRVTRKH